MYKTTLCLGQKKKLPKRTFKQILEKNEHWTCGNDLEFPTPCKTVCTNALTQVHKGFSCNNHVEDKHYRFGLQNPNDAVCGHCLEPLDNTEIIEDPEFSETNLGKFKRLIKVKLSVIPCCSKTLCQQVFPKEENGWVAKRNMRKKRKLNPPPRLLVDLSGFLVNVYLSFIKPFIYYL